MSEDFFPDLPVSDEEQGLFFSNEEIDLPDFNQQKITAWIHAVAAQHACEIGLIQYVFCTDNYLHQINLDFLDHDTLTDIITFPYTEKPLISGDIYISVDRVRDNAIDRNLPPSQELNRVIIHGVLHLCGYGDKTEAEATKMRELENAALAKF